eukprot:CAMPEP_0115715148 /NCGR_PEP_ID=MMETSP0272-20121206/75628_1 /TAXON_ID=71861 /ORGANISM="Scrippsiella trochoidea, Strain CCMP3099" /LENGTH=77 /DNA_ID=CAMNT_0003157361 /DNA_START=20 /DNA_END=249 /DNA_ORIENTATION=+
MAPCPGKSNTAISVITRLTTALPVIGYVQFRTNFGCPCQSCVMVAITRVFEGSTTKSIAPPMPGVNPPSIIQLARSP